MKLLYGTGNPAKLDAMRHRLADLGIELVGLKDLSDVRIPEIVEDGETPLENARKKYEDFLTFWKNHYKNKRFSYIIQGLMKRGGFEL